MIDLAPGSDLGSHKDFDTLFRAWLGGDPLLGSAASEWREFLTGPGAGVRGPVVAPVFADDAWCSARLEILLSDMPDEAGRIRCRHTFERLRAGEAELVVTGQQPGFLGGPLYTLYKVAATVVAAAARTGAGRPTIPLFWSGDDDDDRCEAFAPAVFDPQRDRSLKALMPPGAADLMLGAAPSKEWAVAGEAWLGGQAWRTPLAADLHRIWSDARRRNLPWGRLQARALLRLFRGTDLVVVSGNDSALHEAAAPFYARIRAGGTKLMTAVTDGGTGLAEAGFHVQLSDQARDHCLNLAEGDRRLLLSPDRIATRLSAARLRPGVALRSAVQDWLFRPAGVVVGPGEVAYLKQLEQLYEKLGVHRAPLLPRLFAIVVPPEFQRECVAAENETEAEAEIESAAAEIAAMLDATIQSALRRAGHVKLEKEAAVLARMAARLERDLGGMLRRGRPRTSSAKTAPDWVRPRGRRQERTMATMWAAALWGNELVAAVLAAARAAFASGAAGQWREYLVLADAPPAGKDSK